MTTAVGMNEDQQTNLQGLLRARGLLSPDDVIRVGLISGGRSNLTYRVESSSASWVLRRPPLGHVLSTAHDMEREYTVLAGLSRASTVPCPATVLNFNDGDVIGAPFFLMEYVDGSVLRSTEEVLSIPEHQQLDLANDLVDVLAALHTVDPAAVGLSEFGRPSGFMTRQVARWTRQLDASRSRPLADINELAENLTETIPVQHYSSIVHGDYRLDNCLVRDGVVAAVLDWEMSTLGDPLSDLALFKVYYSGLAGIDNPIVQATEGLGSYPSFDSLSDRYATKTGHDLAALDWYEAFAWFKFAVILEGIHYRSSIGATVGPGFEGVTELVQPSVDQGVEALRKYIES